MRISYITLTTRTRLRTRFFGSSRQTLIAPSTFFLIKPASDDVRAYDSTKYSSRGTI